MPRGLGASFSAGSIGTTTRSLQTGPTWARGGSFIDIRLLGSQELQGALASLPMSVQRSVVRKGLRAAGNIHLRAAKEAAMGYSKGADGRLDEPYMPKIAKGLRLRSLRRSRRGFGVAISTPTKEELGIETRYTTSTKTGKRIQQRGRYPPAHIELGTRKSPALPYMRWPFDRLKDAMTAAVADSIREGCAAAWDRRRVSA